MYQTYSNYLYNQTLSGGQQAYSVMGSYYSGAAKRKEELEKQSKNAAIVGAATIGGGIAGSFGGSGLGEIGAKALGVDEGSGKMVGTILGSAVG